jgi:hypothetical protein
MVSAKAVGDGAVLAGEVDAGAFGGGVKPFVGQQDSGFYELVVEFVHVGHELRIGECAFFFGVFRGFDDESHFVCPFGLSWSDVQCRRRWCRIDTGDDFFGGREGSRFISTQGRLA